MIKGKDVPYGYCHCGCGQKTNIINRTKEKKGYIKGEPYKFIAGHHVRGELHPKWNGGKRIADGYMFIKTYGHPFAYNGYVKRSRLVMEKDIGGILPKKCVVHHVNGDKLDDRPENLRIFGSQSSHAKSHHNEKALLACGFSSWRQCRYCHKWDDPKKMSFNKANRSRYHKECVNAYERGRRAAKRKTATGL